MSSDSLNAWFNLPDFTSGKNDQFLSLPHPCLPLLFAIWIGSSDTGHWIAPNRCKGSAAHARSDQKAEPLQASLLWQIPIALPPPNTFSLLGCCLFQMVPISMVLDLFYVFFQTRTQEFPLLNSCLYWLPCPYMLCMVASIKSHFLHITTFLKISSIPIIHFGCQHIFKLAIQLKNVLSLN